MNWKQQTWKMWVEFYKIRFPFPIFFLILSDLDWTVTRTCISISPMLLPLASVFFFRLNMTSLIWPWKTFSDAAFMIIAMQIYHVMIVRECLDSSVAMATTSKRQAVNRSLHWQNIYFNLFSFLDVSNWSHEWPNSHSPGSLYVSPQASSEF